MQHLITTLGPLSEIFSERELTDFASALEQHGHRCIRPRIASIQLPFETQPVPWTQLGRFLVDSKIRPGSFLQFAAGDYAVQDAASLLPLELMQLAPGQTVIDCCAAPGGKSAAILEQLDGTGLLVSNEVIASRIDTLQLTLARTGYANYMLTHQSVDCLVDAMAEQFDCVLVDAPCTGQSLVGRGKQSLSAFSDHQVAHSAARQQTILESAIQLVRPGGRLIYSTCTFAFDENEGIIGWLRQRLPDWQPIVREELAQWQTPAMQAVIVYGLIAITAPVASQPLGSSRPIWQHTDDHSLIHAPMVAHLASATDIDFMHDWCQTTDATGLLIYRDQVALFDESIPDSWRELAHCGIEVATRFGQHWQPAYPSAILNDHSSAHCIPKQTTVLTDQEALTYFTGTSLHRTGPAAGK